MKYKKSNSMNNFSKVDDYSIFILKNKKFCNHLLLNKKTIGPVGIEPTL